jgi:hypothetical protein
MAGFARERTPNVTRSYTLQTGVQSLDELRAAYTAKTGQSPDKRWGIPRLTKEVASP